MTTTPDQKLGALFCMLLLVSVGPASAMMAGPTTANSALMAAGNSSALAGAGNQSAGVTAAGNTPTAWGPSTEPSAENVSALGERAHPDRPFAVVGSAQPTDINQDGLYEDINGDGRVNIVDSDALYRHLSSTAVGANWSAYDFTGDDRTDVGDVQWLFSQVLSLPLDDLDHDGLPNDYERNITNTDPRASDTDGDGILDGEEDWDQDGLRVYKEYRLGTDPRNNDTDGDGVADGTELQYEQIEPTNPDTDNDGIPDGTEDFDNDTLTTVQELANGTSLLYADVDGDGLTDPQELANGTSPEFADTDNDGLADDVEPTAPFHTNATNPDTDGDGILDGKEAYETDTRNESVNVSLSLRGQGNIADGVTIEEESRPFRTTKVVSNASVGPTVHFDSERAFENATMTFSYNESDVPGDETNLSVYTYNETLQTYVALNSTVDTENNTIAATTPHFSTFTVFHIPTWQSSFEAIDPPEGGSDKQTAVDVVLVMDSSGSMGWNDPAAYRKDAGKQFAGAVLEKDRVAVVDFDMDATLVQPLTHETDAVNQSIERLDASGGTNTTAGLHVANQHLRAASGDDRGQVVILFTDGFNTWLGGENMRTQNAAERAAARNTTIHTIGFGAPDKRLLKSVANETNGTYHHVNDASDLPDVFDRTAKDIDSDGDGLTNEQEKTLPTDPQNADTDGDSLSDYWEVKGVPTRVYGTIDGTDPTENDSDGDGLEDGEEIGAKVTTRLPNGDEETYFRVVSDPRTEHTDGDRLTDETEVNGWSQEVITDPGVDGPVAPAFSGTSMYRNGQTSTRTAHFESNPREADSDGDHVPDHVEKDILHTDPEQNRTYAVTERHQRLIDHMVYRGQVLSLREMDILDAGPGRQLTDGTDDFDFVLEESAHGSLDSFTFTALDGTERTDTWLSNREEIVRGTSVWDPDSDDDGLTDGQEVHGVTTVTGGVQRDSSVSFGTDPLLNDTDGDGYWDGWIGVYGVGRTDNVVLYREHLQSGDGIEGDEIVDEQAGIHEPWKAGNVPSSVTAATVDYDGDGQIEQSNLHVGELQWGTDPTIQTERIALSIETDFLRGVPNQELNDAGWERGIEENYALYGIDIDIIRDERLPNTPYYDSSPRSITTDTDQYMAVTTQSLFPGTGFNAYATTESYTTVQIPSTGMYVYATVIANSPMVSRVDQQHLSQSPYDNDVQVVAAHVAMHEIGHSFGAGTADDAGVLPFGEVYSQSNDDETLERITGGSANEWSIMRSGWTDEAVHTEDGRLYYTLSIEEMSTVSEP